MLMLLRFLFHSRCLSVGLFACWPVGVLTEGGEIPLLYYLPELNNSVLPDAVCKYQPNKGKDEDCPGLKKALTKNPLKFSIKVNPSRLPWQCCAMLNLFVCECRKWRRCMRSPRSRTTCAFTA